jgi:hypothetical protein
MSDEQINIAIAGACGWARPSVKPYAFPNYSNDLNAMHEAEKILEYEKLGGYAAKLYEVTKAHERGVTPNHNWLCVAQATARQRAEAFLRTIGIWEGAKS